MRFKAEPGGIWTFKFDLQEDQRLEISALKFLYLWLSECFFFVSLFVCVSIPRAWTSPAFGDDAFWLGQQSALLQIYLKLFHLLIHLTGGSLASKPLNNLALSPFLPGQHGRMIYCVVSCLRSFERWTSCQLRCSGLRCSKPLVPSRPTHRKGHVFTIVCSCPNWTRPSIKNLGSNVKVSFPKTLFVFWKKKKNFFSWRKKQVDRVDRVDQSYQIFYEDIVINYQYILLLFF